MPEGHTVHRSANEFNKKFAGKPINVSSPQGRFSSGATKVDGQKLKKATAVGKQLFLKFENDQTIRIHLGIYGKWRWHKLEEPFDPAKFEVIGEVRARFLNGSDLAELRGPTVCEVLNPAEVVEVLKRLGPDPINRDPNGVESERFLKKVLSSRTAIGQLLMNQAVISGIGNVYRAELLFRAKISPFAPGNSLSKEQVMALWQDAVKLLAVGVKTGYMITRDELFDKRPTKAQRNFVYKREGLDCRVCKTSISIALMATRKLYWCPSCQT